LSAENKHTVFHIIRMDLDNLGPAESL